jgi:hypothetical protein
MDKKLFVPLAVMLIAGLACSIGTETPEPGDVAGSVAATLTALGGGDGQPPTDQASPQPGETLQGQQAQPAVFTLAYVSNGDVWIIIGNNPPVQLTQVGDVIDVWLSDDGERVLYEREQPPNYTSSLEAIDADGGSPAVLLAQPDLDALYPLDGAEHFRIWQIGFIPGTYEVLYNTRAVFMGPGLATNDDLYRLDTYTGQVTPVIPRGDGGAFVISPDGTLLAISTPTGLGLANIDGGNLQQDLVTFTPVITYSEYMYSPPPVWLPNSSAYGVAIPSEDPLAPNTNGTVWTVASNAATNQVLTLDGNFLFPQAFGAPMLSPNHQSVAAVRDTQVQNVQQLVIANLNNANEVVYDQGNIRWYGWSPDGVHFAYAVNSTDLKIGQVGQPPINLPNGVSFEWISEDEYVFNGGQAGAWDIYRGELGNPPVLLVSPASERVPKDAIPGS